MDRLKNLLPQVKDVALRGFHMFQDNKMSVYSGYATLFIVTAVFPCVILIISIVNLLPGYSAEDVVTILFQLLPDLEPIRNLVESLMTDLKEQSGGLLASAAAVTTLWAANKGTSAIQKGLDQLDSEKLASEPEEKETEEKGTGGIVAKGISIAKGLLKQLLFTLMLIFLIPALLVFEMLGDSMAGLICSAIQKINPDVLSKTLSKVDLFFYISSLAVILIALLVIMMIYAVLPAIRRTLKSQFPGALLTGAGWVAFTELFSFFIPRFYHASTLYGSLASLFLLLLWLRFVIMILFAGGVLNRTLEDSKEQSLLNFSCQVSPKR